LIPSKIYCVKQIHHGHFEKQGQNTALPGQWRNALLLNISGQCFAVSCDPAVFYEGRAVDGSHMTNLNFATLERSRILNA